MTSSFGYRHIPCIPKMLTTGSLASAVALAIPGALAQRTGTLVPRGEGSSMVDNANVQQPLKSTVAKRSAARREIDSARRTMRAFAICSMGAADTRREQEALIAFLKTSPDRSEAVTRANKTTKSECLRNAGADYVMLRFDPTLLRGEYLRQLYLDTRRTPARTRVVPEAIVIDTPDVSQDVIFHRQVGRCVVAAMPAVSEAMVTSEIASVEEDAAVKILGPAISRCVPQGITLQLGRANVSGILSEALFERTTGVALVTPVEIDR